MRKISKIVYATLVLVILAFCLTACGGQKKDMSANGSDSDTVVTTKEEPQMAVDEAKKTDESADAPESDDADSTNSVGDEEDTVIETDGSGKKVLVAYFSATGTTKKLAEYAAEVMGADLYEIGKLLESGYIAPYLVVMRKFVRNKTDIYGYITGISFANQLGLTTQMPAVVEIITNKESTNGRMSMVGNQRVRIKKPAIKITSQNADLLQLLDGIGQAEKYTELSEEETVEVLKNYIRKKNFTRNQLSEVSSVLTGTIAKKLIEWRVIYEFAS